MSRALFANRSVQVASGALFVAAVVALWTMASAILITPTPSVEPPVFSAREAMREPRRIAFMSVASVVDENIFAPQRTAPLQRYRLAGAYEEAFVEMEPVPPVPPVVRGTVVGENGRSFAMCALDGASTVIVRVGDRLGDFTVRSIARGVVEFSTPSGERFAISANPS